MFPLSSTHSWNQLDPNIQNSSSIEIFKRALLKFILPKPALIYKIHHRLGLSHLREHKFRHNFKATVKSFFQKKSELFFLHHRMQLSMTFPKN